MRLTLVISTLWRGGAERVLCILAGGWAEQGHEVSVLTFDHSKEVAYSIHSAVKVRPLDLLSRPRDLLAALFQNFRRIRILRHAIRESDPDVVISFMDTTNVLTLLATYGLKIPVIISEHVNPAHYSTGRIWGSLRRAIYPLADALVCPTPATVARYQAITRVRGIAIPNPIEIPAVVRRQNTDKSCVMIAMGRLIRSKGFDLLVDAFARIADIHRDWSLTIVGGGEGSVKAELEGQCRTLNLTERVHFVGEVADPFPLLSAADLFVFPSRHESFGMALAEAMACGLPAVSFDCPDGPSDIIRDGIDGVLVPPQDVGALAQTLDHLMANSQERARLAARAPEVARRFSREHILSLWQQLLDDLLGE